MKLDPSIYNPNIRDVSEGMIQAVDISIIPKNSVYLALNLVFDKVLGRASIRDGSTLINAQIEDNKSCLGLYQFKKANGTNEELAVFNASNDSAAKLYYNNAGTWTDTTASLTASLKVHFETFLGVVVGVNGTETLGSTDGATWVTTGTNLDIGNMPDGKYVIEFKDRLFVAGVSATPDRLLFSSLPVAGAISWTVNNGFIDIEPEDGGGGIRGLAKVPGYLLIFKEQSMKRWDGQSTFPESMINVGCPSQEGIVYGRKTVFFFNQKGIYETNGDYPQKISRRVQDIIDAIPSSYHTSVSGCSDGDDVLFSIGDITIDSLALTNCVLNYNIDNQHWTLFSFPTEFKMWAKMKTAAGLNVMIAGDDDGNVQEVLNGSNGDNGADIPWLLQTHEQEYGIRGIIKTLAKEIVYTKGIRGGELYVRTDSMDKFDIVDAVQRNVCEIKKELKGRVFEYRLQGQGKAGHIIGIDFPDIDIGLSYNE